MAGKRECPPREGQHPSEGLSPPHPTPPPAVGSARSRQKGTRENKPERERDGVGRMVRSRQSRGKSFPRHHSFLPDLWREAEAGGILCPRRASLPGAEPSPLGTGGERSPVRPGEGPRPPLAGMARWLGRRQQLGDAGEKERRGEAGRGQALRSTNTSRIVVSSPAHAAAAIRGGAAGGPAAGMGLAQAAPAASWGSPLVPDGRGKLRHGAGGGKALPQSA